ncbi:MAG: AmmeMemoRadiSam system radical SAM enzyme [Candidatus Aceula meridiana]|nr:AmmeMemoRadiSam system radical SAM enzyme [Candidatus Aceula meridiana]
MKYSKKILSKVFVLILCSAVAVTILVAQQFKKESLQTKTQQQSQEVNLKRASFWESLGNKVVACKLCPHRCVLKKGETGFCRARKNINGTLYALTYGRPVALHADPIEKKPLAHVYPGTRSFSIATAGCNLRCKFCQNWEISQADAEKVDVEFVPPKEIIARTKATGCKTIAFTYTEPTIFFEYMLAVAKEAKAAGIDCVMHSAGYINEEPLRQIAPYIKAANIDLKGFSEKFYTTFTNGGLETVLRTLKILKEEGVWVEITNLLIPGVNDSEKEVRKLCRWVKENLGKETPIHFSRFFPLYKLANLSPTPISSLMMAQRVAEEEGLQFIYLGNIPQQTGEQTICPVCGKILLKRIGYNLLENNIVNGKCRFCGYAVPGVWD